MFPIGKRYIANATAAVKKNRIQPGWTCHIAFTDFSAISLLIHPPSGTDLKLRVPRALFGVNFKEADPFDTAGNPAYAHSQHFDKTFA